MWIEKVAKQLMLLVGIVGVLVIYSGFFYLLFQPQGPQLPWYILISPWLCIYFGLNTQQQRNTQRWLMQKLPFKRSN